MKNRYWFLLFVFIVFSCKYEDGPLISFVSKYNRVTGSYSIESVTEDGLDKMPTIDSLNIDNLTFDLVNMGNEKRGIVTVVTNDSLRQVGWGFGPDNKSLFISSNFGCTGPPYLPTAYIPFLGFLSDGTCLDQWYFWDIDKLSNSKLWLHITFEDKIIRVHLKKK